MLLYMIIIEFVKHIPYILYIKIDELTILKSVQTMHIIYSTLFYIYKQK